LAFSRKKAFNYERAGKVRAEEEERRTVSFIISKLQNELILNTRNS
jgi:hypothetical protein